MNTDHNLSIFLTKSKIGGDKIEFDGFGYNLKEIKADVLIWRCCKRGCNCILKTTCEYVLVSMSVHNHQCEENKMNSAKVLKIMKDRALNTT
jgi:hypothetical protein